MATKPWGIYIPTFPTDFTAITNFASSVNSKPNFVMWYRNWVGSSFAYSAADFNAVLSYGATPILTWQPRDGTQALHIANTDVTAGAYDAYIDSYINGIKALSGTVYIRLAHEMNGNWYDWAVGQNGNTAASYVAMWQYVWNRFQAAGVTNVKWVWCPNIHWTGETATFAQVYPGDGFVDFIALDGYNYGEASPHIWQDFTTVFSSSLTDIMAVTPNKPFYINELGSVESIQPYVHSKAAWIQDTIAKINSDSRIAFFLYFNNTFNGSDMRLNTSTAATIAFASALQTQTGFGTFSMHS